MKADQTGEHEPPPFLRTWNRVYAMVVIYLAAVIGGLYFLARMASA